MIDTTFQHIHPQNAQEQGGCSGKGCVRAVVFPGKHPHFRLNPHTGYEHVNLLAFPLMFLAPSVDTPIGNSKFYLPGCACAFSVDGAEPRSNHRNSQENWIWTPAQKRLFPGEVLLPKLGPNWHNCDWSLKQFSPRWSEFKCCSL